MGFEFSCSVHEDRISESRGLAFGLIGFGS